jgi:hypothetical protein
MSTQAIEISLPESTLSVSGTVNGVSVVWTNVSGHTWQAEADRDPSDIYTVELTVTEESGPVSHLSTVIFHGALHLVIDRTAQDVARWKYLRDKGWSRMTPEEQVEWSGTMKGAYSHADMNRVEGAVKLLSQRFTALGYPYFPEVKTDWKDTDLPTRADMDRYFGNVEGLRNLVGIFVSTPPVPSTGNRLDYIMANHLEKNLMDLDRVYTNLTQSWSESGEIHAGEV